MKSLIFCLPGNIFISPSFLYAFSKIYVFKEAESEPPVVKTWRDAGDTLCRQNHRKEAKL
jgi:hypothetical protein